MDIPDETRRLVRALSAAIDGSDGLPVDFDKRILDAQSLAVKCLFHASSCLELYGGTSIAGTGTQVLDTGSMNVLARAAFESSLSFHYLFVAPIEAPLREFRHLSWVLSDLLERQRFPATTPVGKQLLTKEAKQIEDIRRRLQDNSELRRLTIKQQHQLLTKGRWRWRDWTKIALDAGMSPMHADQLYHYLCSFAHSGSLSVLQLRQLKTTDEKCVLGECALQAVNIALAFMTRGYSAVFQTASRALATHSELIDAVDRWITVGSGK